MHQLSVIDAVMLAAETARTPNHLCVANIYDSTTAPNGKPTLEQIMAKMESCLGLVPSLRRRLVRLPLGIDLPYWVDDPDFDLEFHVRQIALPRPGDWRQFRTQVARLASRPLDLSRPAWEMTVIDGLDNVADYPKGSFATVLKVHHAAIDGQAGVELQSVLHDHDPSSPVAVADTSWRPEPVPSSSELVRRAALNALTNPMNAVRAVAVNVAPLAREVAAARRRRLPAPRVVRTRFNRRVSAHRTWEEAGCTLDELKRVKNLVPGATLNDLCLSIVGGAMDSYLTELGEPPEASLVTVVPVSTRTPEQAKAGGNQVSGMRVSLRTDLRDPLERVAAIHAETATKKAAQNGVAMPVLLDVAQALPGALIGAAVRGAQVLSLRAPSQANTIVTNVPGSRTPLYFLGCEMVRTTGCGPLSDGMALFHIVSSYSGWFMFLFTADRDVLPDPEPYRGHLQRSIDEHLAAAAPVVAPGKKAVAKKAVAKKSQPARHRPAKKRASTS